MGQWHIKTNESFTFKMIYIVCFIKTEILFTQTYYMQCTAADYVQDESL